MGRPKVIPRRTPRALRPFPRLRMASAEGSIVRTDAGDELIDLTSSFGVAAVGHRNPMVLDAIQLGTGLPLHAMAAHVEVPFVEEALDRLLQAAGRAKGHEAVITTSGSDAVDLAVKLAELRTGRSGIVCVDGCFHGRTLGLLRTLGQESLSSPFPSAASGRPVHHLPFAPEDEAPAIDALVALLDSGRFGTLLLEPMQGLSGLRSMAPGWIDGIIAAAHGAGLVVIADEVFTGFGRAGNVLLSDELGLAIDVHCVGKALTGGVPAGAVLAPAALFEGLITSAGLALDGSTFSSTPLAAAAISAVLGILEDQDLVRRSRHLGSVFSSVVGDHPLLREGRAMVVGQAAASGIELLDPDLDIGDLLGGLQHRGVLALNVGFPAGRTMLFAPPFTIEDAVLERALDVLLGVLDDLAAATRRQASGTR